MASVGRAAAALGARQVTASGESQWSRRSSLQGAKIQLACPKAGSYEPPQPQAEGTWATSRRFFQHGAAFGKISPFPHPAGEADLGSSFINFP